MKKYSLIIAILSSSYTINAAEKDIVVNQETSNHPTTRSSSLFQEWPAQDYANGGNIMQVTAFSHFLATNNIETKNKKILSVGCGTGEIEAKLAEQAHNVLGIDASNKMIEYALINHALEPAGTLNIIYTRKINNLNFIPCPAEYFTSKEKFDLAISSFAFHWFANKQESLKNIANSLEQNGLFFLNIPTADNPVPVDLIVAREMIKDLSNKDTGSSYPTKDEVRAMFTEAGFEIVTIKEQSFTWNPTKEQYSQRQWPVFISRPVIQSIPELQQQQFFNQLVDRCLAKLPQNPDGTYTDVYTGTIVLARKK